MEREAANFDRVGCETRARFKVCNRSLRRVVGLRARDENRLVLVIIVTLGDAINNCGSRPRHCLFGQPLDHRRRGIGLQHGFAVLDAIKTRLHETRQHLCGAQWRLAHASREDVEHRPQERDEVTHARHIAPRLVDDTHHLADRALGVEFTLECQVFCLHCRTDPRFGAHYVDLTHDKLFEACTGQTLPASQSIRFRTDLDLSNCTLEKLIGEQQHAARQSDHAPGFAGNRVASRLHLAEVHFDLRIEHILIKQRRFRLERVHAIAQTSHQARNDAPHHVFKLPELRR